MNHNEYNQILNERLKDACTQPQVDKADIRVVYTSVNLVKTGQQIMREQKEAARHPAAPLPTGS
jgi:hypothetical protein